ncbi:MAG: GxxExxY protein [Phycisphaerales bacterium]
MEEARANGTLLHETLTDAIIGAAIDVHRALGPGLLEAAYEACLAHELTARGVAFRRQVELPVVYRGQRVDAGFRIDLLVADMVIVELKSVERLQPVHEAQLITYLKLAQKPVGLLINFNVPRLKDGILRRALTRTPS